MVKEKHFGLNNFQVPKNFRSKEYRSKETPCPVDNFHTPPDTFQTPSRHLPGTYQTSPRHLQNVFQAPSFSPYQNERPVNPNCKKNQVREVVVILLFFCSCYMEKKSNPTPTTSNQLQLSSKSGLSLTKTNMYLYKLDIFLCLVMSSLYDTCDFFWRKQLR